MDNQFCLRTAGVYVGKFPQPMSLRKLQKKKNAACVIKKINLLFEKMEWNGFNKTDENHLRYTFCERFRRRGLMVSVLVPWGGTPRNIW